MSAFCVFGMTEPLAKRLARDAQARRKLSVDERRALTQQDIDAWIDEKAAGILSTGKVRQVSPAFDAPQFCRDWMDVAKRTAKGSRLRIMHRGEKTDKRGNPMLNKRTGRPVITWVPYKG